MILKEDTIKFSFLLITILLSLTGCNKSFSPSLREIDNILFTDSERGEAMLDSIHKEYSNMPTPDRKYYQLLKLKAADKAYRPIISQKEEIDTLVSYFQHAGDKDLLAEAYFYAGRVYYEFGDKPEALKFYQKASENVAKDNYALQGDIYCQMANVYRYVDLYKEALSVLHLAWKADSLSGNNRNMLYDLRDIGEIYYDNHQISNAEEYFQKGQKFAYLTKENIMLKEFHHQLACICIEKGKWNEALYHVEHYINNMEDIPDKNGMLVTALVVYSKFNNSSMMDSCYKHILKEGNIFAKQAAIEDILSSKAKRLNDKEILPLLFIYKEYTDSIIKENNATAIKKGEQSYNYELKEKDNQYLHRINSIESVSLIMIIIIAILALLYFYLKIKSNRQQQKILELKLDKYKNLQNKKEIKTSKKIANETCHIRDSDIYKLIKTSIDNNTFKIVEQDWDKLQELINEIYRDFDHNLNAFYEVYLQEYRICLLIKIGVTPTNIAHIMNLTKEAITASRRRMYMKAFKTKGTPSDWDNIIKAL